MFPMALYYSNWSGRYYLWYDRSYDLARNFRPQFDFQDEEHGYWIN